MGVWGQFEGSWGKSQLCGAVIGAIWGAWGQLLSLGAGANPGSMGQLLGGGGGLGAVIGAIWGAWGQFEGVWGGLGAVEGAWGKSRFHGAVLGGLGAV